ncbi:MAG: hypothetical protein QOJ64_1121 [Acidobacteriota bacterium]|nr:hypothetical protein [Acidobacteriota bacterium]
MSSQETFGRADTAKGIMARYFDLHSASVAEAVKGWGALNGFSSRTSLNFTLIKSCTCVHPLLKCGHLN